MNLAKWFANSAYPKIQWGQRHTSYWLLLCCCCWCFVICLSSLHPTHRFNTQINCGQTSRVSLLKHFFSLLLLVCLLPSFAVYYEMIFTFTHMGNVLQSLMGFSCEYFTHSKAIENWSVSVYNGSSQLLIHISELTTSHFHMMAESVPYTQQPLINCIDSNIWNNGKLLNCMAARILCTPRRHIMCLKSSRTYQPTVVGFIMRSQLCGAHKLVACIINIIHLVSIQKHWKMRGTFNWPTNNRYKFEETKFTTNFMSINHILN